MSKNELNHFQKFRSQNKVSIRYCYEQCAANDRLNKSKLQFTPGKKHEIFYILFFIYLTFFRQQNCSNSQ